MKSNLSRERISFSYVFITVSGFVTKAGPVGIWDHTKNEWIRKFLVLRRPYLYLYSSPSELDEEAAISVFALRLDHGERVSDMFRVRLLFGKTDLRYPMFLLFIRVLIPF